jgi:hypothetical protein
MPLSFYHRVPQACAASFGVAKNTYVQYNAECSTERKLHNEQFGTLTYAYID